MNKSLAEFAQEQDSKIKASQAQARTIKVILNSFPDAVLGEIEGNVKAYISPSVKMSLPKAQPEILCGNTLMVGGPIQHYLRWFVRVGTTKVYSREAWRMQNSDITEFLNMLLRQPSGREKILSTVTTRAAIVN